MVGDGDVDTILDYIEGNEDPVDRNNDDKTLEDDVTELEHGSLHCSMSAKLEEDYEFLAPEAKTVEGGIIHSRSLLQLQDWN